MLFENKRTTITAEQVAAQLLQKANRQFSRELEDAKSDFKVVWHRTDGLTGIQILKAMGPSAQAAMTVAWLRVQMLVGIATALGKPELVNVADFLPPVEVQFNEDGSVIE